MIQPRYHIVLVAGYARAGKDTFAAGLVSRAALCTKVAFADCLKAAANRYLKAVGLYNESDDFHGAESEGDQVVRNFFDEDFKKANRDILVQLGRFARSIDRDVFVKALCTKARMIQQGVVPNDACVVVPDWRYLNELRVVQSELGADGWKVVTVLIEQADLHPANEEEAMSLAEIRREHAYDFEYSFAPGQAALVRSEGQALAARLGLC